MKEAPRGRWQNRPQAYTLFELLTTMAIIGLLAALLMPAVSKGYARARRVYCINSLRQSGIAFHGFAHGHDDKFPIQVSTNAGGSLEWLQSTYGINDEFYFSYRHFLPLANELRTPKILTCPSDTRQPALRFESFHNENLSYFVAANPELGKSDSVVAGDRNLSPTFGSIARIGGALYLKWTRELHQFRGNVLFADGHVEQLNDILRITNATSTKVDQLLVPSVPASPSSTRAELPIANQSPRAGTAGSNAAMTRLILTNLMLLTNPVQIVTTPSPRSGRTPGGSVGGSSSAHVLPNDSQVAAVAEPSALQAENPVHPPVAQLQVPLPQASPAPHASEGAVGSGRRVFVGAFHTVSQIPWYLILALLLGMLELRRRIRKRQRVQRSRFVMPRSTEDLVGD
jgi:prepilin-type processing-associated H-X9-DG protein/prepilin-type N-terminal cleavage/methylation domain-containing protein